MEKKLIIRDYSKIYIMNDGTTSVIYSLLQNGLYVGSVEFNLKKHSCKIQNLLEDIPMKDIENCVYQQRIKELESLKAKSHKDSFEILDNLLNDLRQKIHE